MNMASPDLLNAFNDCIDRLAEGQSVDDCLRDYPQFARDLRPMLETGRLVQRIRVTPLETVQAQARVRHSFEQALLTSPARVSYPFRRLGALAAGFLIVSFVAATGTAALAQNSLPGDALYGAKRLTENLQLSLSSNDRTLEAQFNARRLDEIQQLLTQNRAESVTFQGRLSVKGTSNWQVADLTVQVNTETPGAQTVQIDDLIEVQGFTTSQGIILGQQVTLLERGKSSETTPLPPTMTSSPTPTLTPTVTATPSPSFTPSATTTPMISPSPTPCVVSAPGGWVAYHIQIGDTLSNLAARGGITLAELMTANCLTNPNLVVVGQQLHLPISSTISTAIPTAEQPIQTNTSPTDDHGGNSGSDGGSNGSGDGSGGHGGGSDDGSGHG
jgi:LysM repeat protein